MRFRCRICNAAISDGWPIEPWDPRCEPHVRTEADDDAGDPFPPEDVPEPPDVPALPQPGGTQDHEPVPNL